MASANSSAAITRLVQRGLSLISGFRSVLPPVSSAIVSRLQQFCYLGSGYRPFAQHTPVSAGVSEIDDGGGDRARRRPAVDDQRNALAQLFLHRVGRRAFSFAADIG